VSWRSRVRLLTAAATAAGVGVAVYATLGAEAARGAGAGTGGIGPGGVVAVTYQVSGAAQRAALAFWSPVRRAAAQPLIPPQAALPRAQVNAPNGIPKSVLYNGVPTVGTLFYTTGTKKHFCSAAAVDSTAGDLVIAAAHCVYGNGPVTNAEYVPDYHNGRSPYGAWPVRTITVAAGWAKHHYPYLDFAFLAVGAAGGPKIQARTGGLRVGSSLPYKETIEVVGYNDTANAPIRCLTKSFEFRTKQAYYMEFYCHGFWTGTSGSPWIIGYNAKTGSGTVCGVIGGYEEGGNYDWASYSAYFGSALRSVFTQAEKAPSPPPPPPPSASPSASAS
jgi:V8-like Glu-specific endopeptidase